MNATDRRDSVVGALRCALRFGGLTDAVAYAARLDGLASRAVKVAELADDELRPLAEDALKYLDPRPRPKAFERLRALCGDEGIEVRVLNAHAEVSVPQRLRWDLGRLLTASANDRSRDPLLRRAAAFARRALVLCDQGDPLEPGTSNLVRAVRAAPLQVEDVGLDPVRIEVMPAHDLVDELARLRGVPERDEPEHAADVLTLEREGAGWRVLYDAERAWLPDSKGLAAIAALRARADEDVSASELLGRAEPAGADEMVDEEAVTALKHAALKARARGDAVGIDQADQIEAHLRRVLNVHGRPRLAGDDAEKARKAAREAIERALRAIERAAPRAGAFLRARIVLGKLCRYSRSPMRQTG